MARCDRGSHEFGCKQQQKWIVAVGTGLGSQVRKVCGSHLQWAVIELLAVAKESNLPPLVRVWESTEAKP